MRLSVFSNSCFSASLYFPLCSCGGFIFVFVFRFLLHAVDIDDEEICCQAEEDYHQEEDIEKVVDHIYEEGCNEEGSTKEDSHQEESHHCQEVR